MKTRWPILSVILIAAACSSVPVRFGDHKPAPIIAFSSASLSDGVPAHGRQTFIAMQCIDCHQVSGDPGLPLGKHAIAGPVLANLDKKSQAELARLIRDRNTGAGEELFGRTMKDYAQPLSAQQLADTVAYLRVPRPIHG